jgi:hypothetical protein
MWPFSKKSRRLELPPEDQHRWGVAQVRHEALVVRYNQTAGEWAGHSELPVKLGFSIPLHHPNQRGLPAPAENVELGPIEALILREVSAEARGVHVLTLTSGTMKEWVFYIAPGADIAKLHASIRSKVSSHEVQCMALEEPNWESYRAFVP